ncbi:MAG: hypothetical protein ACOH18_02940 [Candidatus Saccharimonadaceae bacterium]
MEELEEGYLETPFDPKLVTYPMPTKRPLGERTLRRWEVVFAGLMGGSVGFLLAGTFFGILQVIAQVASRSDDVVIIGWMSYFVGMAGLILVACSSATLGVLSYEKGEAIYRNVPQGKVVEKDAKSRGKKKTLRWVLLVQGNNSLNQPRTQYHTVSAADWRDKYEAGQYVDFS